MPSSVAFLFGPLIRYHRAGAVTPCRGEATMMESERDVQDRDATLDLSW